MIKLSQITDDNLKSAINTIMSNISSESQSQDYDILNAAIEEGKKDVANYLLDHNCAVNVDVKSHENTPLHNAVKLGDVALIDKLLMRGALVTIVNDDVNSPLHLAFLLNHTEIVDRILVNIQQTTSYRDVSNKHGLTHLHIACARGNAQVAHDFEYTGADPTCIVNKESPVYPGYTCLRFACESKSVDTIEVVVRAIDPPTSCINNGPKEQSYALKRMQDLGRTLIKMHYQDYPLLETLQSSKFQKACFNGCVSEVKNFLEKGMNVNTVMSQDAPACPLYTPLHFAMEADKNRQELVELLLANGADVTLTNGFGMTPLHLALYNDGKSSTSRGKNFENDDVVGVLYAAVKDKDANPMDMFGLTYFHVAVTLNDMNMVEKFLKKGQGNCKPILPNCRNFAKYTPLHFAARYGHEDMAKLFIDQNADVNANEDESQFDTPLQVAIQFGQYKMVDFLLRNGANAKVVTSRKKSNTLHLLVQRFGYYEDEKSGLIGLVKSLINHCVDINAKDTKSNTALHRACGAIDTKAELVCELINWGADVNLKNWCCNTAFDIACYSIQKLKYYEFYKLYDHIEKLKTLGWQVISSSDLKQFFNMMRSNSRECGKEIFLEKTGLDKMLETKQAERLDEIERLKVVMIGEKVSLHNFLKMDVKEAYLYVTGTDKIKKLIFNDDCTSEYQNYGYLIEIKYDLINQWLTARQSNNQATTEKPQVESAVIRRSLLQKKNSTRNTSQQEIPDKATLHFVITLGNIEKVTEILQKIGISEAMLSIEEGNSPLHLAFILNQLEIVDLLLSHMKQRNIWVDANTRNKYGLTHLHVAAARGNVFVVEQFLNDVTVDPTDFVNEDSPHYPGYATLQFACDSRCLTTIMLIHNYLFRFTKYSQFKHIDISPFHHACLGGSAREVSRLLESCELDVNARIDRYSILYPSYTALHFAVKSHYDSKEKVEMLLQHGADSERRNGSCMTPLHLVFYALDAEEEEVNETLLVLYEAAKTKEVNTVDAFGLAYFHIAVALGDRFLVKKMLFQGEDVNRHVLPNAPGFSKYTPLHFAVRYKRESMVKLLLERGAHVNGNEDFRSKTPLDVAIIEDHSRIAEILRENGGKLQELQLQEPQMGGLYDYVRNYIEERKKYNINNN